MKRRHLLKLSTAGAAALTVAAGALWWVTEAPRSPEGRLNPAARGLFAAVGTAVLAGVLPTALPERAQAITVWLQRLEATISGMPPATQAELDQLIVLLSSAPARLALTGLQADWPAATPKQVEQTLRGLQHSTLPLRQQVFHALRDLSNAAYFAAPETWSYMGYPGPLEV